MRFQSTKTFGHELGLSCCFRQWRADSHCSKLHGYALAVKIIFEGERDGNGWVIDFGSLGSLKADLQMLFDHTLCVAGDDPLLSKFEELEKLQIAKVMIFPAGVGCEAFAKKIFQMVNNWLNQNQQSLQDQVRVVSVEVKEHGANSAIYLE